MLEEVVGLEVVPVVSAACGRCDNDDCSPRWCIVVFMAGDGLWYCIFLVKRDIVFLFSKNN
jgi:hypothetical protein